VAQELAKSRLGGGNIMDKIKDVLNQMVDALCELVIIGLRHGVHDR
jgi:hypothetical protein